MPGQSPLLTEIKFVIAYAIWFLLIVSAIFLVGCTEQRTGPPWTYATDQNGNTWPAECPGPIGAEVAHVEVTFQPRATIDSYNGKQVNGVTFSFGVAGDERIVIATELLAEPWRLADVIYHEFQHVRCGFGWHP